MITGTVRYRSRHVKCGVTWQQVAALYRPLNRPRTSCRELLFCPFLSRFLLRLVDGQAVSKTRVLQSKCVPASILCVHGGGWWYRFSRLCLSSVYNQRCLWMLYWVIGIYTAEMSLMVKSKQQDLMPVLGFLVLCLHRQVHNNHH